ncbi:MAG: hypothetical protein O4804_07140 [Trichodesmium sp. St11_bin5]|nr:hypothetical protein [Trichodesmium sp. St11_bin5]MDT9339885.1 hypothetical protein [Trichodesmium erythraeum 21-75]
MSELPKTRYSKLIAYLNNPSLPDAERNRLEEAVIKYHQWRHELDIVEAMQADTVEKLVAATNKYKGFPDNFIKMV